MATKEKINPNKIARMAGFLYIILAPLGMLGMNPFDPTDAATRASNIMASESLFRLSIMSALITQVVNILVVLLLYKLLKPVNKDYSALMVIFLLAGVPITMLNQINQSAALLLVSGADYLTAFSPDQLQALAPLFLDLQEHGLNIAGLFWGLWLLPMGYLVFKSGYIPKILGILLIIGGFGYLIDSFTFFLLPNFLETTKMFTDLTWLGELLLALWLLIKGVNVEQWEKRALESA
jgi:hypothetical protein